MMLGLKLIILILTFSSAGLLLSLLLPMSIEKYQKIQAKKINKAEKQLEEMFVIVTVHKLILLYTLAPLLFGTVTLLVFKKFVGFLPGAAIGFALPTFIIKMLEKIRKQKFRKQLGDTLMTLSSSLKGGLSLLQAFEVLAEEMAPPVSQEFSLILRENKMGVSLEESLTRLNKRMELEELELVTNSILVARETGGDLTKVFSRLSTTIRDKQKIEENIKTLTLQGKIQGMIMSILPFVFVTWVLSFDRRHFDIMLTTELGRMLLFLAVALQIIGMFLIQRFSKLRY